MISLTEHDQKMLSGDQGEACVLAMRILTRSASLMGARSLVDITSAHIDGCLYHGQASLDFVDRLVSGGGKVAVPTTLNVGSIDLIHPELFKGDRALKTAGTRLMEAHAELGCEPSFTCAPYQLKNRPVFGQQIAWAESNAIVFANSVLGARTNRYGDFIDLCAAITGRAPYCGLHLSENRHADILFEVVDFPEKKESRDIYYALLGFLIGKQAAGRIPAIRGLPLDTSEDELKALGAASASSGSVAMFHAIGITPEASDLETAFGGRRPGEVITLDLRDLSDARTALSKGRPGEKLAAVSVGTPHFSLDEFSILGSYLDLMEKPFKVDFYVNTSRFILWQLKENGLAEKLQRRGVTIVTDTCTYITPIMNDISGLVMTNSGKWAHYAPANIGVSVAFGTLWECVASAGYGEVWFDGQ
ncbi:aconitase X catalytic domain-containing protein [Herbaspirillum sp. RV1423]|uniref:aconitase X n=1 Tax=Herbaspirillum sp. RV1423 TaxID=1443993 RepID=UPI0004B0B3B4|nr:aconitase X catalytic domain-containing protein [Herbaspirillum sp. RV1423]